MKYYEITRYGVRSAHFCLWWMWCPTLFFVWYWVVTRLTGRWRYRRVER